MRIRLILALSLIAIGGPIADRTGQASDRAVSPTSLKGPRLAVDQDQWDFGSITAAISVGHVFKLRNEGNEPLQIGDITTSCGCAAATLANKVVLPGKEVALVVTFNSSSLGPGMPAEKTISVYSNDPQAPLRTLSIKATLSYQGVAGVGIEPKYLKLEKGEESRVSWKKVVLSNQRAEPVEVRILETAGAVRRAVVTRQRIPSNGQAELRLLVDRRGYGARPLEGHSVTLSFPMERREERVTLPVEVIPEYGKAQAEAPHPRTGRN